MKWLIDIIKNLVPLSLPKIDLEKRDRKIVRKVISPLAFGKTKEDIDKQFEQIKDYSFSK